MDGPKIKPSRTPAEIVLMLEKLKLTLIFYERLDK